MGETRLERRRDWFHFRFFDRTESGHKAFMYILQANAEP
jgi:hypothetical protein